MMVLGVMVGGALGALCRYLVALALEGNLQGGILEYPVATFTVNILGSFLLAFLFFSNTTLSPEMKTAVGTGFLGALTTFSTFELETFRLFDEGRWVTALSYSLGSLLVGLGAVLLGRWAALQLS